MDTFVQHRNSTVIVLSPKTHCPIMIRANEEGASFSEEVCRCDVVHLKKIHHPGTCNNTKKCPVREELASLNQKVTCEHGLL